MSEARSGIADRENYPGIGELETIIREIRKPNGDRVTLFDSGSVVLHRADLPPRTRTAQGHVWTVAGGGVPPETEPAAGEEAAQRGQQHLGGDREEVIQF